MPELEYLDSPVKFGRSRGEAQRNLAEHQRKQQEAREQRETRQAIEARLDAARERAFGLDWRREYGGIE